MRKFNIAAKSCLAVITARGGSKGVVNKNLRNLAGRPTISYTIETGLACPYIDELALTTDSPALRKIGLDHGISVPFLRPAYLADDLARQEDAILHLMDWYEQRGATFDLLCLLEPTSPLRKVHTLNRGFELLLSDDNADAIFSVSEAAVSPVYCNELREDGTLKGFIPEKYLWANRQELPVFYKLSSLVTICRWDVYKKKQTFLLDTTLALKVDPVEAIDIDEPLDFFVVESLMRAGLSSSSDLTQAVNGP
jgi:CMP-N,N'-diacetyllegionaminic acid synthase